MTGWTWAGIDSNRQKLKNFLNDGLYFSRKSRLGHVLTISSYGAVWKAPGDQQQGATLRKSERATSST